MRLTILTIYLPMLSVMLLLAGCGPKQRLSEGQLDTPLSHYNQGMRKLETGNLTEAQAEFQDALNLDAKYALGWAGLSLVSATRGAAITDADSKERKRDFNEAQKNLDKAEDLGKKSADVWVAHIRMYALWKNGEDWVEDARKGFDKAVKLDAKNDAAYYWMGLAYKGAYNFRKSEDMLRGAIDIDKSWSEKAGLALEQVHKIVEAEPGTKYGRQIALVEHITRADLAVLFIEELNVVQRLERRREAVSKPDLTLVDPWDGGAQVLFFEPGISDINGHWAESMIRDIVKAGVLNIMPAFMYYSDSSRTQPMNRGDKFYPDTATTRIEFAAAVQSLLYETTGDGSLFTKYVGEPESHIRDMRTDHPLYSAAMLCVERNVMQLDKTNGYFYPQGTITGAEAVLFIRDLKNALKW